MFFLVQPSPYRSFASPPHFPFVSLPSFEPLVPTQLHLTLVGFKGAIDDALFGVLHEFAKEDKGNKFVLKDFRSPPPVDAKMRR